MYPSKSIPVVSFALAALTTTILLLLASSPRLGARAFLLGGGSSLTTTRTTRRRTMAEGVPILRASSSSASSPATPTSTTSSSSSSATTSSSSSSLTDAITNLKRVLTREYVTFFDPMVESWYSADVKFDDPLTSLVGVQSYKNNVDMLAGRTLLGKIMFDGACINLHSVTGGEVVVSSSSEEGDDGKDEEARMMITDVVTRWTLKVTVKALPWKPEAVFSGVSIYELRPGGTEGVLIIGQKDYWDSINMIPNSSSSASSSSSSMSMSSPGDQYRGVDKGAALKDFLGQLRPDGFRAVAAAPELPYLLLRRGDGYDVRRYPSYVGIETTYDRRDYGYAGLGAFAVGMDPLAPSVMRVYDDVDSVTPREKTMTWPLRYANPGEDDDAPPPPPSDALSKAGSGQWKSVTVSSKAGRVVAVRTFEDAAVGPAVRNADRELRTMLRRDGLVPINGSEEFVEFAQYDAVHSMGRRRTEVWIELAGHPF